MLWAAPTAALGSAILLPLFSLAEGTRATDPRQMSLVFGTALLSSWAILVAGKLWEGKKKATLRKMVAMAIPGALIGLAGFGLWDSTHLGPVQDSVLGDLANVSTSTLGPKLAGATTFASFFSLAMASFPWWAATARDRRRRVRLWPVLLASLLGGTEALLFPGVLPFGPLAFGVGVMVAGVVSPWSREAATYAREARRRRVA